MKKQIILTIIALLAMSTTAMAQSTQTFTVKGVSFKMVDVEGGTFMMGGTSEQGGDVDNNEKPAHRVTVSSFMLGQTEVTQGLWQAVMGDNPSNYKSSNCPVEQVSWDRCQVFINRLNQLTGKKFRLPTEAEWEYAARGGNKGKGYKYSGSNSLSNVAWYSENSGNRTHIVASKSPNELGLYDMSGNVYEWCQDVLSKYDGGSYSGSPLRVYRGGCWTTSNGSCRVSYRSADLNSYRSLGVGLRLAL